MQKSESQSAKGSFGLQDILYVLFKHKWKILTLSAIGFAAAATVFVTRTPIYESTAKIMITYVLQRGGVDAHESEVETGGRSGDQVINTELEILRSGDLATEVAGAVGVDRLLPGSKGQGTLSDASNAVLAGLVVAPASKGSNVVMVVYRNPDPELTRDVLREVMKLYPTKHLEIHRSVGAFDSVAQQVDEVRNRLQQTEAKLNKLKSESGILSVNEESLSLASLRDKTRQDLVAAEAERDAQEITVQALAAKVGTEVTPSGAGRTAHGSQAGGDLVAPPKAVLVAPRPEEVEEYRLLSKRLEQFQQQDFDLRTKFAPGNPQIVRNQQEIDSIKSKRTAMIKANPGLIAEAVTEAGKDPVNPLENLKEGQKVLDSMQARIKRFQTSLAELETRFKRLTEVGPKITELERQKEMEDGEYRLLESNLKKARVDRTLDPTQMPNLPVMQQPSVPQKTYSDLTTKLILGLAGAGVAAGLGLAFLLELVVDRRIKGPAEIETRLQVPLMLSIPYVRPKNRGALLIANDRGDSTGDGRESSLPAVREANGYRALPGRTDHFIHPYSEAIRDRIVFNFQINNMTHKPKMMAVTGLSAGAGTSTIAAGLAKAFSEVNGAKVLLVDLNSGYPDDNPMFGTKPLHSLVGALQAARNTRFKEGSQNLYLASAAARTTDPNAVAFGPMHLYELLPHFRASEFDYIIFDMPPMGKTSPTLAMAGLMDKVLLVVDGEDTNRETLKWGYSELLKGRADVSCVFNKAKSHAPRWIAGEV